MTLLSKLSNTFFVRRFTPTTKALFALAAIAVMGPATSMAVRTAPLKIGTIIKDCTECPDMVAIPQVGHTADNPGKLFYAGRYEITWRQYLSAISANAWPLLTLRGSERGPWPPPESYLSITDDYPLTQISRLQFQCYLDWLHKKTGFNYRIPSAAEWEHAARAGTSTKYPWGDSLGYNNAIVRERGEAQRKPLFDEDALIERFGKVSFNDPRFSRPQDLWPVGSLQPNAWGLYDVIGNVEEITNERANRCMFDIRLFRKIRSGPCVTLYTRGQWLPRPTDQSINFTLVTHRNAVEQSIPSLDAGFRIFRD